jgi:Predicted nucleoside-diphosphate sugar epimerase
MKHVLITGGTGLIGSALCKLLLSEQHQVTVLSRQPDTVPAKCGQLVKGIQSLSDISDNTPIDWVFNFAGEPIADKPWTKKTQGVAGSKPN